jgi:hypothetical protein
VGSDAGLRPATAEQRSNSAPAGLFSSINARRVNDVQAGGRFTTAAAISQERPQMRDDMLKGLTLVFFALHLDISFDVSAGQRR